MIEIMEKGERSNMYIYLAGPMQIDHRFNNVRRAIDAAHRIEIRGHTVFVPHLNEFWNLIHTESEEFWMKRDFLWLRKCEVLVRLSGISSGSDKEVELARRLDMKVFGSELSCGLEEFMKSPDWTKI